MILREKFSKCWRWLLLESYCGAKQGLQGRGKSGTSQAELHLVQSLAMKFVEADSCSNTTELKPERKSLILARRWRYLGHVWVSETAWKASWKSIPKTTSRNPISWMIHRSSASTLLTEGMKASLEWNRKLPWWSLKIHVPPTIDGAFLQLPFMLHLTKSGLGCCQTLYSTIIYKILII